MIELKNIKHTAWASQETHCYQATLYVDGERWGTVSNQGHGGPDDFHGENGRGYADLKNLNERIGATYPLYTFADGSPLKQDLEMVCAELVNEWLRDRDFNKKMKSYVLFTDPDKEGVWMMTVRKPQTHRMLLDSMKAKYPHYTYLSDLPVEEARNIYFAGV